ncbi:MAG: hypothetical protein J6Z49_11715 [Kiritimatiellae bacterium]|nr:hypothetical protein [Kiritimatiellia bacterium]
MGMKRMLAVLATVAAVAWTGLAENVTNVRGMQREKSNLVDIYYDIEATDGGTYTVAVQLEGRTNEVTAATFSGDVGEGIAPGRNRHILWNAGADWPGKKGDVRAIVTATKKDDKHGGVQLWEGGPYWADRNVGASSPEDYGLYFWWGDTVGYRPSGTTFGFSFGSGNTPTYNKSIATLQSEGWIVSQNGTYVLAPSHDAAHVQWGGAWRMPTYQELYDLCYNKCDWAWTSVNGVNGYVVRGRGAYASNSIFLPCAGRGDGTSLSFSGSFGDYWSSVPYSVDYDAYGLYFDSSYHSTGSSGRSFGQSVRPVQGFAQ